MKKIIIVQTGLGSLEQIKESILKTFPKLGIEVLYGSNFELSLLLVPKIGEVTVIASNVFHDDIDVVYTKKEKTGSRYAQIVKEKINPQAKVYIFSSESPESNKWTDGFYKKRRGGWYDGEEVIEAFYQFGIVKRPTRLDRFIEEAKENIHLIPWWVRIVTLACIISLILSVIRLIQLN